MKILAKTDYACRALLELSLHWPKKEPLSITVISERQKIPLKFLTQILLHLKNLGLVSSTRGQQGGYLLATATSAITINDVLLYGTVSGFKSKEKKEHVCDVMWQEIDEKIKQILESTTFEDILQRDKARGNVPMYTI